MLKQTTSLNNQYFVNTLSSIIDDLFACINNHVEIADLNLEPYRF